MARNQQQIRHPENVGSWEADGWVTTGLTYHACSVAQLCLCNSMVCSPPGSSVHEILQARIPEWVPITFFGGSSPPRDRTCISCIGNGFFTTESPGKPNLHTRESQKLSVYREKVDFCLRGFGNWEHRVWELEAQRVPLNLS